MKLSFVGSFVLTFAVAASAEAAPELLYGNSSDLGVIKSYTPGTSATATKYISTPTGVSALAANDTAQRLYVAFGTGGSTAAPTSNLFTYDYAGNLVDSKRIVNTETGNSFAFTGLTYGNGSLYGTKQLGSTGKAGIYSIDPVAGTSTLVGALSNNTTPTGIPTINYSVLDIDYDATNNRFISTDTQVANPLSERGTYSIVLPSTPGDMAIVTKLADPPSVQPTGANQPDGVAINGTIAYLTYNRSNIIARFDLTTNTYLSNVTGAAQTDGAAGDATFANGFVGAVPEPTLLAGVPLALALLRRRRVRS